MDSRAVRAADRRSGLVVPGDAGDRRAQRSDAVSRLQQLYQEAGRAATFMRRLERSLESAGRIASAGAGQALLGADDTLAGLIRQTDPFVALAPALARIGARPVVDTRARADVRRLSGVLARE